MDDFDPYHKWLGIPADEQPPTHYRLLGIKAFENDADVIQHAADQRMSHLRTFQTGKHAATSQRLLNEVASAGACLLNTQRKRSYDAQLRGATPVSEPAMRPIASLPHVSARPVPRHLRAMAPLPGQSAPGDAEEFPEVVEVFPEVGVAAEWVEATVIDDLVPCRFCREPIQPGARKCKHCGEFLDVLPAAAAPALARQPAAKLASPAPLPYYRSGRVQPSQVGLANTALVLAIIGFFCFGLLLGGLAIGLGCTALNNMSRSRNREGYGIAMAAVILGIVDCIAGLFFLMLIFGNR